MSSILKYIVAGIVGALICFLCFKSCDKSAETIAKYEDSIKQREIQIDSVKKEGDKAKVFSDSVFSKSLADSAKFKHRDDSLVAENKSLKGNLSIYRDSANTLWKQLKTDYLNGDTTALRLAYYGLREQLDSVNSTMVAIQFKDQAIEYNLRNAADSAQQTVRLLYSQLDTLKVLLDKQTKTAEDAISEERKILAAQKKKKIWDIIEKVSIGLGALFLGSKL